ncbi:MAG: adenylate/guanylate cyclase domain-containing protein [Helicobacteraceae bacterium]|jgi:adenylate cyclase|nr:adenylate/guanylate cyclase domain-containing protein [Helicobacteraceae bacterium]
MKRLLIQIASALLVAFSFMFVYLFFEDQYRAIDNGFRDYLFAIRGVVPTSESVVIIDIDERSLSKLGQWPWERDKVAKILENLAASGVGIIGIDAVFAEPDNSSPKRVLEKLGLKNEAKTAPDYDAILGEAFGETPTIAGYVFIMEKSALDSNDGAIVPAIFLERGRGEYDPLLRPERVILNLPAIQEKAYSSGYFNTVPDDSSGIIRYVPLVMRYQDAIYPSLAFEMLRAANEVNRVVIAHDPAIGVEKIILGVREIPTDRFGRIFVNYRGASRTFPYISAVDIYENNFSASDVEGKFALIGTSAAGLLDLRATPFENVYPGVEIHANVIDNILMGDFISRPSWAQAVDLLLILISATLLSVILAYSSAFLTIVVATTYTIAFFFVSYVALFEYGFILNLLIVFITIVSVTIMSLVLNFFLESRQKELIRAKLVKKLSPNIVKDLLKNPTEALEGREREITLFFSDIRGFTNLSESIGSPKELIKLLNDYMTPMTDIIMSSGGTLDKFIGDAIMAYWNAPAKTPDHADKAINAAISQIAALQALNEKFRAENRPMIEIGVGINTGFAIVGEMGSIGRADYTAIGDSVNLASRLEGLNKIYGTRIIFSEFTRKKLKGKYIIRELDLVRVKGKSEAVAIYEAIGLGAANGELAEELALYKTALDLYRAGNFVESAKIFSGLNERHSQNLYKLYFERSNILAKDPPHNFDGVWVYHEK